MHTNIKFIKKILFLSIVLLSTAKFSEANLLSPIVDSVLFKEYKHGFWSGQVKASESLRHFKIDDEQVVWVGLGKKKLKGIKIYWYSPDSKLFEKTEIDRLANTTYKSTLLIKYNIPEENQGRWRVEAKDEFDSTLDEMEFYIGSAKSIFDKELNLSFLNASDEEAHAILLLSDAQVSVNKSYQSKAIFHKRIKILTEKGRQYGEVSIPIIAGHHGIDIKMAHTILPTGKIIPATEIGITQIGNAVPIYTAQKILVMSFPAVEVGSIVEYEIALTDQNVLTDGFFSDQFAVDGELASVNYRRELITSMTQDIFIKNINHDVKPDITEDFFTQNKIYVWEMKNIPPIKIETYMPTYREVGQQIIFSTSNDWEVLADWWRGLESQKDFAGKTLRDFTRSLADEEASDLEKLKNVYAFVKDGIRYVGFDFGRSVYETASAEDIFEKRYGDCKNQSILLKAMLKVFGIDAHLALLRTIDLGPLDKTYPTIKEFNHMIVVSEIDGERYYLDPTGENYSFGLLPYTDVGADIFIVKDDAHEFDVIKADNSVNKVTHNINLSLTDTGQLSGTIEIVLEGQENGLIRTMLKNAKPNEIENIVNQTLNSLYPFAKLESFEFLNEDDIEKEHKLIMNIIQNNSLIQAGDIMVFRVLNDSYGEIPAYLTKKRQHPIQYVYASDVKTNITITLPESLTPSEMPKNSDIGNGLIHGSIKFSLEGNKLSINQQLKYKALNILLDQYEKFKADFEKIVSAQRQNILLKKKNQEKQTTATDSKSTDEIKKELLTSISNQLESEEIDKVETSELVNQLEDNMYYSELLSVLMVYHNNFGKWPSSNNDFKEAIRQNVTKLEFTKLEDYNIRDSDKDSLLLEVSKTKNLRKVEIHAVDNRYHVKLVSQNGKNDAKGVYEFDKNNTLKGSLTPAKNSEFFAHYNEDLNNALLDVLNQDK